MQSPYTQLNDLARTVKHTHGNERNAEWCLDRAGDSARLAIRFREIGEHEIASVLYRSCRELRAVGRRLQLAVIAGGR